MSDEEWYWDLERGRAVPAGERGRGDNTLGPYASKAEAEAWRSTVERRNDEWSEADEEWTGDDDEADDD